jgi:hypothetical protein
MYWSAVRGANWLYQMNERDGHFFSASNPDLGSSPYALPKRGREEHFLSGVRPSLRMVLEGDHYLRQAGAAFALARAARFTGEERFAVRASQAILLLLEDTVTDPKDPQVRHTALPSGVVNRLAAAGLLVLVINELPAPKEDLLEKSEQLCNYIRAQQQSDGSLCYTDNPTDTKAAAVDPEGVDSYPGPALYGLIRSQQYRPAAWKLDVLRKAVAFYRPWWQGHKNPDFVPWQTAAYTEAYLLTKEQVFADCVYEMNDWLCGLQYDQLDPRRPLWYGGFQGWANGKPVEAAPQVGTAFYAQSLAEACRLARATADVPRHRRYSAALECGLQFVTTLQYTEGNTQHFADWYRPYLVGGFHASHQDGNLGIDYTQHAVSALVQYLTWVVRSQ